MLEHWCGLRMGEVAVPRIASIVDESGAVKSETVLATAVTKSKRARCIFVPRQMQQQLKRYLSKPCHSSRDHYLFSTQKHSNFKANAATQHLQRLYDRAGIVGATSYSGRRTQLTELSAKGVGVWVLAEIAGHASIRTTQRYIDINDEQMCCAAELI